jgi:hypothetical protein
MWAQSTAIDAAIKANPSRGGGAKLRVSLEEVAGLPNSDEGSTMLRPTKHERERRLSHTVSPFTEGLNITRVLQVKFDQPCAAMVRGALCEATRLGAMVVEEPVRYQACRKGGGSGQQPDYLQENGRRHDFISDLSKSFARSQLHKIEVYLRTTIVQMNKYQRYTDEFV